MCNFFTASSVLPNYAEIKKVFGIFGIIRLVTGFYNISVFFCQKKKKFFRLFFSGMHIIVITHRVLIGLINGEYIYRVAATEILPYVATVQHFSELEVNFLRNNKR